MIILSLGSNLNDNKKNISTAISLIEKLGTITAISHGYESEAWGYESDNKFLNIIATLECNMSPLELLEATQAIEREMGRATKNNNATYSDRIIDIDIICFNGEVIDTPLLITPHPLMHKRNFVLLPLGEIAPMWQHPILKLTAEQLKLQSPDNSEPKQTISYS